MASNPIINNLWGACNKMRQDPETTGALQYIQQFSWLYFLKFLKKQKKNDRQSVSLKEKNLNQTFQQILPGVIGHITKTLLALI
jgi:type I restriction-modification system DNA methylase subunit